MGPAARLGVVAPAPPAVLFVVQWSEAAGRRSRVGALALGFPGRGSRPPVWGYAAGVAAPAPGALAPSRAGKALSSR